MTKRLKPILSIFFLLSLLCLTVSCAAQPVSVDHLPGLTYSSHQLEQPRPIRAHLLIVDLAQGQAEPVVVLAPESPQPDRNTIRTDPKKLAEHPRLMAFVNTNPWTPWTPDYPTHVNITGLAATQGVIRTPHDSVSLWTDPNAHVHIGTPSNDQNIREGTGGFQQIIEDGNIIIEPGGALHPRTAIGTNLQGDKLYLLVVQGRKPGFSEGMSLYELAEFLRRHCDCWDAANMDGGGSSVMGIVNPDGDIQIVNTAPGQSTYLRPLPTILTIRRPLSAQPNPESPPDTVPDKKPLPSKP